MKKIFLVLYMLTFATNIFSGGSDTDVSVEPNTTFLTVDNATNAIRYFAWMKNGFSLENAATICAYRSLGHTSSAIDMNDGTLSLTENLILQEPATIDSWGTFSCAGRSIVLPEESTTLPTGSGVIEDGALILRNDVTLEGTITFSGSCEIIGNGYELSLGATANIIVDSGSILLIKDTILEGVAGTNISCADDTAQIIYKNVNMYLADDYTFDTGLFIVDTCFSVHGLYTFIYESTITSQILTNSKFTMNYGSTVRIGRFDDVTTTEPLLFTDETSWLELNIECTR